MTTMEKNLDSGAPGGGILSDPPTVAAKIDDDRVLVSALRLPNLPVVLDGLDNAAEGGYAQLFLTTPSGRVTVGPRRTLDGALQPITFDLPTALIPELPTPADPTEYSVDFEVFDGDGNDDHSTSATRLRIDLTPPWQVKSPFSRARPPAVTYVNAPPDGVLNRAWFNANPGGLRCIADVSYPFRDVQDTVRFCLSARSVASSTLTPVYEGVVSPIGEFTVPAANLIALGSTTLYQIYTVADRVGNRSIDSLPTRNLEVRLPPAPTLFAPTVPVTGADGSLPISLATYNPIGTEVFIEIRRPTNGDIGDVLNVSLGGIAVGPVTIVDATTTPLRIALSYDICDAVFGTATQETVVVLNYSLVRGTDTPIPSPNTNVFLNLIYPGPDLIPEPDLESVNLPPVEARGATGTLNHIVPADFGQPVVFTFRKWDLDLGADLISQAIVTFYYNNKAMGDQTLDPGQASCELSVPFQTIAEEGQGKKNAYVTLEYPGNPNIVRQKDPTEVLFEAVQIDLLQHVGRTFNTDQVVSCPSLDGVAPAQFWKVTAPAQAIFTASMVVTLTAQGYENIDKTAPIGVPFTQLRTVAMNGSAVDFEVPFAYLKSLQGPTVPPPGTPDFNYMEMWYSITISGAPFSSPPILHRINVRNTSSLFCDGTV
ncbi:hypothetical protein [Pseudomonas prosekii]|uniref:hypothetical protein n=1 Tax=Pseudomonas prosekii TaxID=1148509 RepID=UPI003F75459C